MSDERKRISKRAQQVEKQMREKRKSTYVHLRTDALTSCRSERLDEEGENDGSFKTAEEFVFEDKPFLREKEGAEGAKKNIGTSHAGLVIESLEPRLGDNKHTVGFREITLNRSGEVDEITLRILVVVDGWEVLTKTNVEERFKRFFAGIVLFAHFIAHCRKSRSRSGMSDGCGNNWVSLQETRLVSDCELRKR